ncbi:Calcium-binding protein [Nostoc sp. DSM 114161]|jgi:Ca2+-binding RTX toxin-like protein|uniref:beta strand repeat-containing protein n=1 Tax=Nostoc sp. DSM 114161 TaxID=3440143 RepID=UPI0040463113
MANIIGTNGDDTLQDTTSADTINGKLGNDTIITSGEGNDTLTGGGGNDTFVYDSDYYGFAGTYTITDFGGVGKGTNPTPSVIAEVDKIQFFGVELSVRNLLLTQNGSDLEITFESADSTPKFILQNFKLEDLENLKASGSTPAIGNIIFNNETTVTDSFNVVDANSTDTTIGIKNTVTFLNDLANNITGLNNSDDVINGQGGNDKINGLSGNDLLRGGVGNDTLIGCLGNDTLVDITGNNSLVGGIGDDRLNADFSTGDNFLDGGSGNDYLNAEDSEGNNLLSGGDGDDILSTSYLSGRLGQIFTGSLGNNTLNGGTGNDTLRAESPTGNNLLNGGNGNDFLSTSGRNSYRGFVYFISSGNNTLNGGAGNDTLLAEISTGNNLLSGGDDNDYLDTSGGLINPNYKDSYDPSSGNNTLNGGAGNDTLRAELSTGNNLLSGGDGNDYLSTSGIVNTVINSNDEDYNPSSGNNTLNGGAGNDTLRAEISTGNNLLSGGDGNDSLYVSPSSGDSVPSYLVTQTVDGGKDEDLLSVDYTNASTGITTTFNATTNVTSIAAGKYQVNYKNIERLNISGTAYNDNIVASNGNDTLTPGNSGKDTIDGGRGGDLLFVDYSGATTGITSTYNATTNIGSITAGANSVNYKNIERLDITGTYYDDFIVGTNGNDILTGGNGNDTLYGGSGIDTFAFDIFDFDEGSDRIYDFNATNEVIQVSPAGFGSGLSAGVLKANQFTIGASATTSAQRFIYNSTTGELFFDQDGSGGAFTQLQFALVTAGLSLTNNNFVVV